MQQCSPGLMIYRSEAIGDESRGHLAKGHPQPPARSLAKFSSTCTRGHITITAVPIRPPWKSNCPNELQLFDASFRGS